jgi:hypothetical protein
VDRVGGVEEGLGERGPELIGCKIVAKCVLVPATGRLVFRWMVGQGTFNFQLGFIHRPGLCRDSFVSRAWPGDRFTATTNSWHKTSYLLY